jgi:putative ABC transport system substrate-binding protein
MRRRRFILLAATAGAWQFAIPCESAERTRRIAIVVTTGDPEAIQPAASPLWTVFFQELQRLGYAEGRNLIVERYSGEGRTDSYSELAKKVVASKPELIVCFTTRLAFEFKAATTTTPIVTSATVSVDTGLVPSLARPGGNITGVDYAGAEFYAKQLQLLRQVIPAATRIAYLMPRAVWESPTLLGSVKEAAKQAGISLVPALLESPIQEPEYRRVFAALAQDRVDGLLVGDSAENLAQSSLLPELAAQIRLPTFYPFRVFVENGGLMSLGPDRAELRRRMASNVAEILNGAKPGDIPFYQATRIELVINLKTARALGLEMPGVLLAGADELIE